MVQKDPSKADDFRGEHGGAGDAGAIDVITDTGDIELSDQELDDNADKTDKDKTS